jgi:hypothetical protein
MELISVQRANRGKNLISIISKSPLSANQRTYILPMASFKVWCWRINDWLPQVSASHALTT